MLINERPEENRNPDFDNEASLREADSRLGLQRVIEQYGFAPQNGNWKSFTCPFCKKKGKAGVFEKEGTKMFKCQSTSCPTGAKAMPAVQFIAFHSGLSNKDAFVTYLKEAGVWKDRTKFKGLTHKESQGAASPGNAESTPVAGSGPAAGDAAVDPDQAGSATGKAPEGAGSNPEAGATADTQKQGGSGPDTAAIPPEQYPDLASTSSDKPEEVRLPGIGGDVGAAPVEGPTASPESLPNAALAGADNAAAAPSTNIPGAAAPSAPVVSATPADPDGWRSLKEFFSRLSLSDSDRDALFAKRGLFYHTSAALRFRSNPKANRDVLVELQQKYGMEELLSSGLYLREDKTRKKERRPNSQFFGMGVTGKKAKSRDGEDGEFTWGWVLPILIPYFDETGELIGLRPHKGMGRSGTLVGTPQVYIPRGVGGPMDGAPEVFHTVIITEGEFKAAAIWQVLGAGRMDGIQPLGVAALPGISFGKNYEAREVLDDWLRRVKCREVIVVYDNEDKSDPKLESFKPDKRKRFDAQIWARYLATDLAQKLHIFGRVGNLPSAWRNNKGKADWDGAMADIVKGKELALAK